MRNKYFRKTLKRLTYCAMYLVLFCTLGFSIIVSAESAEVVDRIVAVVNNDIVVLSELNELFKPYAMRIRSTGYTSEKEREMLFRVRGDILNQLIDRKLTDQEIKRYNITVSEKEIDSTIERIKEASLYTDEELREALAGEGLTMEEYRKNMKEQILRTKLVNFEIKSGTVITGEDIKLYYETHSDQYCGKKKYHLQNIIMRVPPLAGEAEKLAVFKKMEEILSELKKGESFETMAGIYSESSLSARGGDLGLFGFDELSPQLQEAVKEMNAGEFTSVLDTDQGYQIFLVREIIKTKGKSIEEVSTEIEEKLFNEINDKKFRSWIENLRKRSHIKVIK